MPCFLGIDTSNYTTSVALWNSDNNCIEHRRKLLPVTDGALGLRQSDAVFSHVKQMASLMEDLFSHNRQIPAALGVSLYPRDASDSYMPCFLVGEMAARSIGAVLNVPVYGFSHQAGHIMAALYSAKCMEFIDREFIAFHVSGGTTDCLLVRPSSHKVFDITTIGTSLDLKAGQAVDRVGKLLGLSFPAGKELDALSLHSHRHYRHKPVLKDGNCCLSGIENICRNMSEYGESPADIALCCIDYLGKAIEAMTAYALRFYPGLPVIYCGGVMSNTILRQRLGTRSYTFFADTALSADNACGAALLAALRHNEGGDRH